MSLPLKSSSSPPDEIVSPPCPLGRPCVVIPPAVVVVYGTFIPNTICFEFPVFDVSGCDGVLLLGLFCLAYWTCA